MTGMDLFLNTELRPNEYVNGYENIHYGIFKIFIDKRCKEFFKKLINVDIDFDNLEFDFQPNGGLFDFMIKNNGFSYFWELKVWQPLSETQFNEQDAFLESQNALGIDAKGIYVLFTKSREKWIENDPMWKGRNLLLGEKSVLKALKAIEGCDSEVREIIDAYKQVIQKLDEGY